VAPSPASAPTTCSPSPSRRRIARARIDGAVVDEVYAGCANQAGEDNRNVARMAVLLAGLPQSVPAVTVNRLCASGLEAILQASRQIRLGEADVVVAGGVESMSRAPWVMQKPDGAYPTGAPAVFDTSLGWRFPNPKMAAIFPLEQMGETAENLVDAFKISRERQDAFALRSHQRAVEATRGGAFTREIVPVVIPGKKGDVTVAVDEQPRDDTTLESPRQAEARLPQGGRQRDRRQQQHPQRRRRCCRRDLASLCRRPWPHGARYRPWRPVGGRRPAHDGHRPGAGHEEAPRAFRAGVGDLSAIELNEAFAAQALSVTQNLGLSDDDVDGRVNLRGGAIAMGHPLGCSGARIVTTLLSILEDTGGTLGLATLCVGVGQGLAVLVDRDG
jgi:acetyl-CoA acyltransferase